MVSLIEFPQDRVDRTIVALGPVSRAATSERGVLWSVQLRQPEDTQADEGRLKRTLDLNVSSAYLPFLKVGAVFRGQDLKGNMPSMPLLSDVEVDTGRQRFARRFDCEDSGLPRFFVDESGSDYPPYVVVQVTGLTGVSHAVLRCSEVVRFYVGQSSLLAEELFNFFGSALNLNLYNPVETGWSRRNDRFVLSLKKNVGQRDGMYLAMQLAWDASRDSLAYLSRSVRLAISKQQMAWPRMPIPDDGVDAWSVYGQIRPVILVDGNMIERVENVLAVTQIAKCKLDRRIDNLVLKIPRDIKSRATETTYLPQHTASVADENMPWSVEKLPGVTARPPVVADIDILGSFPGMHIGKVEVAYNERKEDEGRSLLAMVKAGLEGISAITGPRSNNNIADLSLQPDVPHDDKKIGADEHEEPQVDRSTLPNLMEPPFPEPPRLVDVPYGGVPAVFDPVIHAAARFSRSRPDMVTSWYDRSQVEEEYQRACLLELPAEWGRKALHTEAPNGLRRALCLRILTANEQAYVLDIERVSAHDSFGVHILFFRHQVPISLDVIGKVIKWRLFSSKAWPDRNTHDGDFWVRRMHHVFGFEAKDMQENRLAGHLETGFSTTSAR